MLERNIEGAIELLKILEEQEKSLVFDSFNHKDALKLGTILSDVVNEVVDPISIRVFLNDVIVYQYTMGGDYDTRFSWTLRKYNLIKETLHSSMHGKTRLLYLNELLDLYKDNETYGFGCGGFPITVKGKGIVGALCLSGLPDPQDHFYVVEALQRMLNINCEQIPSEVDESWFKL